MKRRNPNDATLRNVRAAKGRDAKIDRRLTKLEQALEHPSQQELRTLRHRLDHVEDTLHELFSGFVAAQKVQPQLGYKR